MLSFADNVLHRSDVVVNKDWIDKIEKLIGRIDAMHFELAELAKKKPNDGVNKFKLGFLNGLLSDCNSFLGKKALPLAGFQEFAEDDLPTNSDVTFVLTQYQAAIEKVRSDNIHVEFGSLWFYDLSDNEDPIQTSAPKKLRKGK